MPEFSIYKSIKSFLGKPEKTPPTSSVVNRGHTHVPPTMQSGVNRDALSDKATLRREACATAARFINANPSRRSHRPLPDMFPSQENFENAYLHYQSKQMGQLQSQHPQAFIRGSLYHGADLPPERVFDEGLGRKGDGDNFDLREHQRGYVSNPQHVNEASALRGGCLNALVPAKFAHTGAWVYKLRPVGGSLCVEAALGHKQIKGAQAEQEFSFGACQPGWAVEGAYPVLDFSETHDAFRLGAFIKNPTYRPPFESSAV
jgi:hypothetical protein